MTRRARPTLRETFASNFRRLRAEQGWSQEQLAERAGLHRTYVSSVERAERNVSIDNIERLAAAFEQSAKHLLEEVDG